MKLLTKKNQFMFLVMASFILVSTTALALSANFSDVFSEVTQVLAKNEKTFPGLPTLSGKAPFPVLSAQAALAVDLDSGVNLYEKNPDEALLPASTTKIITSMVALNTYPLDNVLTVGKLKTDGQRMGLITGEQMKVENLLYGLLVFSANDAAEVLAQNYPGGYSAFIDAMNSQANYLSMTNSHFENPVGLDGVNQKSTARDLIRASEVAMRDPEFAKIVATKNITVSDITGKKIHKLTNINELLGNVPGVLGVKTGWTENARENLVTYIDRDGHKIMIAVLGSQDRFGETKELIDWIYSNYSWESVKPS